MATLLSTLGTSWAIVPEAFLLGNGQAGYECVFVLTTSSNATLAAKAKTEHWFASHAPQTSLRVLAIEHMQDLSSENEHKRFEEALYQVYFHLLQHNSDIHVCLAGGFKTMSASAQEAAGLLGCSRLFHLLADPIATVGSDGSPGFKFPDSDEDIRSAIANHKVRIIHLGSRAGWPTIRELAAEAPALPPLGAEFLVEDHSLQNKVHHRVEAGMRLAASERELAALPFPQLARWAPGERDALEAPLNPHPDGGDHAWIQALPKVELHCHLGGFATHGELLRQVRAAAEHPNWLPSLAEPSLPPGWPSPAAPIGLEAYRVLGNANGSALLKDPGCLAKQIELLYRHFQTQNIIHAEVRCSPANYASDGRSAWDVLCDIRESFERCRQQAINAGGRVPLVNLIIIATRQTQGDFRTGILRHVALATTAFEHWTCDSECRVVGVDLAGFEDRVTRAHYFRDDFMPALRLGMGITVHAGENDDAEGIWSAILDLNTRRLGHALHLADSPTLLKTVVDRRIGIEMCPYANLQIVGFQSVQNHETPDDCGPYPLKQYLDAGAAVTINTDNIGISSASLGDNLQLLPHLCPGITRLDVLWLLRNAIDQAFLPPAIKTELLRCHLPRACQGKSRERKKQT